MGFHITIVYPFIHSFLAAYDGTVYIINASPLNFNDRMLVCVICHHYKVAVFMIRGLVVIG